jgi:hypothetical protein
MFEIVQCEVLKVDAGLRIFTQRDFTHPVLRTERYSGRAEAATIGVVRA